MGIHSKSQSEMLRMLSKLMLLVTPLSLMATTQSNSSHRFFEGDILLPPSLAGDYDVLENTAALVDRWTDGVVPYKIKNTFNQNEVRTIKKAMEEMSARTCIKFIEAKDNQQKFLTIKNDEKRSCWASVGSRGRPTTNLGWCGNDKGVIQHELIHVLGFFHEHSRWDRDDWVKILFENIEDRSKHNFKKRPRTETESGLPYDYCSIMHYPAKAFSKNGRKTIQTKKPVNGCDRIGQNRMTDLDIKKINKYYDNCKF